MSRFLQLLWRALQFVLLFALLKKLLDWIGELIFQLPGMKTFGDFLKKKWDSMPSFFRERFFHKLIASLVGGLSIMWLMMDVFYEAAWVMDIEDTSMDWLMELNAGIIPPLADLPPFVFVDINDETYHQWGEPLFTPRHRLTHLINAAVQAKARMVIVDIDLSRPTPVESSPLHPNDRALKNFLENYVAKCRTDDSECPNIIFARAFQAWPNDSVPIPRAGFLEELVAQSAPLLQWASPHFYLAEDQVIRRWQLWQPACNAEKQPIIVPSMELLAMAEVQGCSTEQLQTALRPFLPQNCQQPYVPLQSPPPETVELCQLTIGTNIRDVNQRIMYTMPWFGDELPLVMLTQANEEVLTICSAQSIESGSEKDCLDRLTNSIVVIGGSHRDGGDTHLTPLGDMPGSLIIINAIHSLLQYQKIEQLPNWVNFLLMATFIVIMSLLFAWLKSFWGMIISGALIIVFILPLSLFLFKYGVWLDFALPLIVVQVFRMAAECKDRQRAINITAQVNSN